MFTRCEKFATVAFMFVVLLFSIACQPNADENSTADATLLSSNLNRELSPQLSAGQLGQLIQGQQQFAFDVYGQLAAGSEENLFFSPLSIYQALGMTYAGARNNTAAQMAKVMGISLSDVEYHRAMNAMDQLLNSRKGGDGHGFKLNVVNALWGQRDYPFLPEFLDTLAVHYGAGLRTLDFMTQAESCRQTINKWVSDETAQKIPELIAEGLIDPMTRLVLTNAIYFNAAWAVPFNKDLTQTGPFTLLSGESVAMPFMVLSPGCGEHGETISHYRGEGYDAVQLPYENNQLGLLMLVPDLGYFRDFEANLSSDTLNRATNALTPYSGSLTMPKFSAEGDFELSEILQHLGMRDAFDDAADFTGIVNSRELSIAKVVHKATITVDEDGTEAAAATAVIMRYTSVPDKIVIDRPFIFFIRDFETNAILFMGSIKNPIK